jgi:hypothetical protein
VQQNVVGDVDICKAQAVLSLAAPGSLDRGEREKVACFGPFPNVCHLAAAKNLENSHPDSVMRPFLLFTYVQQEAWTISAREVRTSRFGLWARLWIPTAERGRIVIRRKMMLTAT